MARILIVTTGGTRAPSQIDLAQRFLADGHEVRLVASHNALRFLASHMIRRPWKLVPWLRRYRFASRETLAYFLEKPKEVPHLAEGKWADVVVMAPATCNSVGKLVSGISDNYPLLVIRGVPRTKTVIVVPSMNPEMWYDPAFQRAVDVLNATDKYRVLCPSRGEMLSGDWGIGCQVPLEEIVTETYRTLGLLDAEAERFLEGTLAGRVPWVQDSAPPTTEGEDVLLVDEDETVRRALAKAIRREYPAFRVHEFSSAGDALEWCSHHEPDLVLTELEFGSGCSGRDLIEQLRRPGRESVHVVATSMKDRREAGAEQLSLADVAYLPKPYDVSFAVGLIAGALRAGARQQTPMATCRLEPGETSSASAPTCKASRSGCAP